ncbi:Protein BANP [Galemys pyrenaicus]|uniref:Protein BANP n=1 Tax=Galemys pyrenaicus TaxID=202257 RepID=A0A8J5ZW75_GALPY|nr:Protein BANP [Galemys pyrenaicus]
MLCESLGQAGAARGPCAEGAGRGASAPLCGVQRPCRAPRHLLCSEASRPVAPEQEAVTAPDELLAGRRGARTLVLPRSESCSAAGRPPWVWMMSEQDLADVVQIAVEDLSPDHPVVLENHVVTDDDEPALKRQRLEISCQDPSIKSFLCSINQTICLRLDSIEAKLQALEATCKSLEEKLDLVTNKQHSPIQVPMVAGSPLGATQTCNKVRCACGVCCGGAALAGAGLCRLPGHLESDVVRVRVLAGLSAARGARGLRPCTSPGAPLVADGPVPAGGASLGAQGSDHRASCSPACGRGPAELSREARGRRPDSCCLGALEEARGPHGQLCGCRSRVAPGRKGVRGAVRVAAAAAGRVVPQTTVILNSDRQSAVVAKTEDPLCSRAPDPLENIVSKSVAPTSPLRATAVVTPALPAGPPATAAGPPRAALSCVVAAEPGDSLRGSRAPCASPRLQLLLCPSVCPSARLAAGWRTPTHPYVLGGTGGARGRVASRALHTWQLPKARAPSPPTCGGVRAVSACGQGPSVCSQRRHKHVLLRALRGDGRLRLCGPGGRRGGGLTAFGGQGLGSPRRGRVPSQSASLARHPRTASRLVRRRRSGWRPGRAVWLLVVAPAFCRRWAAVALRAAGGARAGWSPLGPLTPLLFLLLASAVPGRRQNTIVVKVPGQEDSHEDGESGSEASDSVSNCGQPGSQSIGSNVTLITLNSEGAPRPCLLWAARLLPAAGPPSSLPWLARPQPSVWTPPCPCLAGPQASAGHGRRLPGLVLVSGPTLRATLPRDAAGAPCPSGLQAHAPAARWPVPPHAAPSPARLAPGHQPTSATGSCSWRVRRLAVPQLPRIPWQESLTWGGAQVFPP